jgi:hypothetical protein
MMKTTTKSRIGTTRRSKAAVRNEKLMSFDELWQIVQETSKSIRETAESMKETDRKMRETDRIVRETDRIVKETSLQMKETDRKMQETDRKMQETDRKMKETDRKIGALGSRLGEIVENLMTPDIYRQFNKRSYQFTRASRDQELHNSDGSFYAEIDVFVENGDYALVIEVKTKLKHDHITEHIERMNKLRKYADAHNDNRKYIGAVASLIIPDNIRREAVKAGFFVIEANEDSVSIKNADNFKPKEW